MQVYGDASLDAPYGSQIHYINLKLHLPLTLDAQCGYSLKSECFGNILSFDIHLNFNYVHMF